MTILERARDVAQKKVESLQKLKQGVRNALFEFDGVDGLIYEDRVVPRLVKEYKFLGVPIRRHIIGLDARRCSWDKKKLEIEAIFSSTCNLWQPSNYRSKLAEWMGLNILEHKEEENNASI